MTSIKDDSIEGDTNNDGDSTSPAPSDWTTPITFLQGSSVSLENTIIRYGGFEHCYTGCTEIPMIQNNGATVVISNSTLSDCPFTAILQSAGSLIVSNTDFVRDFYALRMDGGTASINHSNIATGIGVSNNTLEPIDATDNWWGDSTGPKDGNTNNAVNALGAWVFGHNVSYVPWLEDELPVGSKGLESTNEPTCAIDCFSSVLFLPGLEASRLYENDTRLWEPGLFGDSALMRLSLTDAGESISPDIRTKDVIDEALIPELGPNIYKSFMADMDGLKADGVVNDWEAIPYDWRLAPDDLLEKGNEVSGLISYLQATSSPYIIQELERLAHQSKTGTGHHHRALERRPYC